MDVVGTSSFCDSTSDCNGVEYCNQYDFPEESGIPFFGLCVCPWSYGFGNPPFCNKLTADSVWGLVCTGLSLVLFCMTTVLTSRSLVRVISLRRQGFTLSTAVLAWLSSVFLLSNWSSQLAYDLGSHHRSFTVLRSVCLCLGMAGLISAALNVSLMWIEFVIATEQMRTVSSNLKVTRWFLVLHLICFLAESGVPITMMQFELDHSSEQNTLLSVFVA